MSENVATIRVLDPTHNSDDNVAFSFEMGFRRAPATARKADPPPIQ